MSKIKSIQRKKIITETLHNIGVNEDESYIANGIVVHNCKSYIEPILKGDLGNREVEKLKPSKASLDKYVQFSDNNHKCDHKRMKLSFEECLDKIHHFRPCEKK